MPQTSAGPNAELGVIPVGVLAGLAVSGLLFGLPGAILPSWGFHISSEFSTAGNYFLSLCAGVLISAEAARRLLARKDVSFLLIFACVTACAALVWLALVPALASALWRAAGLIFAGFAAGLLNVAILHVVAPLFERDPAATINLGGIFFGVGCLAVALLVAGTFYAYTVTSILLLIAAVPGVFAIWYARNPPPAVTRRDQPALTGTLPMFRSPGAVLFALLLFFQFGNEWSIAGWLPVFLTRRLGISPAVSLVLLSLYWCALIGGRVGAVGLLPRMRHRKLLVASSGAALFGCVLLLFTNNRFGAATGTLLAGGGFACIYPLVAEQIGHRFPWYHPGFFNGIFSFALLSGLLAPALLGYAADAWGVGVVMGLPLLGTCMVFILVLLIWLDARLRGD